MVTRESLSGCLFLRKLGILYLTTYLNCAVKHIFPEEVEIHSFLYRVIFYEVLGGELWIVTLPLQ